MDLQRLRELLRQCVVGLHAIGRHVDLPEMCEKLGLPPPDEESGLTKRQKMEGSFAAVCDEELPAVAARLLERYPPSAADRNTIQDLLWADIRVPVILKRYRREVAEAIGHKTHLDAGGFDALLESLWVLDTSLGPFDWSGENSLRASIERHMHRNDDWSANDLFEVLGAYTASNRRFALFLEGLSSSDVRPDEASQRWFVNCVNDVLRKCRVELCETSQDGGYPVFSLVSTHEGVEGRPKNLIFASPVKPDLRFRDAVNNDIEIVTNADRVLVYDRPIGNEGLRWRELQAWWSELRGIADEVEAKRTLYVRLRDSLPATSPPQRFLFKSFYEHFSSAAPDLPVLLPEVWLHWDPKTVQERGADALARYRMDFLVLLGGGVRVVVEVDGKQHYSNDSGEAAPAKYASLVAADRELKLSGYEVFRFAGVELAGERGRKRVGQFFEALFRRYSVALPLRTVA